MNITQQPGLLSAGSSVIVVVIDSNYYIEIVFFHNQPHGAYVSTLVAKNE